MRVKVLIVEGKTDEAFFKALLENLYGFKRNDALIAKIPIGRHRPRGEVAHPLVLAKDDLAIVVQRAEGKQRIPKIVKHLINSMNLGILELDGIFVVRDLDRESDVSNWIEGVRIYGMGKVSLGYENVEERRELELSIAYLAKLDGILDRYSRSISALREDKGEKLTPKDLMHLLSIAERYGGDCLSGLYEKYIGIMAHRNRELLLRFLSEIELLEFLEELVR
ncbi:hypothetical protein PNA2_0692 [Pyrococcus sp. NA2]|uniref:DUF3226 domain-containing protein n=1 Tax=Pyrococcus sp. (strain NA2) TaxID=342949 RepID=UPI000209AD44|nr:DUF3226 domain-containing protein [Pyrococcus sp. NA2]AEC51608.1 hypothetical protein PNA2_0692 [Pyrococcus sp. NA2]